MRRLIAAIVVAACVLSTAPAEAFWGHHCGWRGGCGGYGYRGYGYGGYGYGGGYGYRGWGGYGGYGGYRGYGGYGYPSYNVGYPGSYGGFSSLYGSPYYSGYGGSPLGIGMAYYGVNSPSALAPATNLVVTARPAAVTIPANRLPQTALATQPIRATGAQALQRFLGMSQLRPVVPRAPAPTATLPALPRMSNVEARRQAERLIADGDELFRKQNFNSALQRYKAAASAAPDLAEAFWRQGHALVATKNFALATTAFKRAVALTEDLSRGGFRLDNLYGGAAMTKTGHAEWLAEYALVHSGSSDPYFLLGVFLNYDGQTARAEKFFQRASELAGIGGGHIAVFLAPAEGDPRPASLRVSAVSPPLSVPIVPVSAGTEI